MSDEGLSQAQFPEHIYDGLHGCLVGDGDGRHVEDAGEEERRRSCVRLVRGRSDKQHQGIPSQSFHGSLGVA